MTPQEKAEYLVKKFSNYAYSNTKFDNDLFVKVLKQNIEADTIEAAKQCAIFAVDEIIYAIDWHEFETPNKEIEYWQEVKIEIEKL